MPVRVVVSVVVGILVIASTIALTWPEPLPSVEARIALPPNAQAMVVREVLSGDTIVVETTTPGSQVPETGELTAKLIGVDAPNFGIIDECFAQEAAGRTTILLPKGSIVWLTLDREERDASGRWLAYLWTETGDFVNFDLVINGYAPARLTEPNDAYWTILSDAQSNAGSRFRGLWGACPASGSR